MYNIFYVPSWFGLNSCCCAKISKLSSNLCYVIALWSMTLIKWKSEVRQFILRACVAYMLVRICVMNKITAIHFEWLIFFIVTSFFFVISARTQRFILFFPLDRVIMYSISIRARCSSFRNLYVVRIVFVKCSRQTWICGNSVECSYCTLIALISMSRFLDPDLKILFSLFIAAYRYSML